MKDEICLSLSLSLSLWLQQKASDDTSILFLPSATTHFSLVSYCLRVRVDDGGNVKVRGKQVENSGINSPNDARFFLS
jgi:hypothetical protein